MAILPTSDPPQTALRRRPGFSPRSAAAATGLCAALLVSGVARATDVTEFPDNGTEQLGRAGAWVARASNPLATFQNPAGLAGQRSGVLLDVNLVRNEVCFTRAGPGSKLAMGTGVAYREVCNDNAGDAQPLPALAAVFRATERLGIGLSAAPPSVYGALKFPETQKLENAVGVEAELPAPQRYQILEQDGIALNVTLGAGAEVLDGLRVGAGFVWGFAAYDIRNANQSIGPVPESDGSYLDPVQDDVRADLAVADWFMPGVVVGVLWSAAPVLDLGFTITAQEAFDAHGDLELRANYWTNNGVSDNPTVTKSAEVEGGLGHFRLANPLDARLGVRYHQPRRQARRAVRDPLADDVFDVELDFSYTRNSAYDRATLRFPASPIIPVQGTPGTVPENNDMEFHVKGDSIGARLGGDVVVVPAQLAVRAGVWVEPDVQDEQYANVAMMASQRVGVGIGTTVRIGALDVEAGYQHVFFAQVDNHGNGKLLVVSGDASDGFRSPYPINGGKYRQSVDVFSLGATARF